MKIVITCEHAAACVPKEFERLFMAEPEVLSTHEAFDLGARELFDSLKSLADFHELQKICRLLIETNRSIGHQSLFSRFSRDLPLEDKQQLLHSWYFPYRNKVENRIDEILRTEDRLLHFSIHSFTPVLKGDRRNCDIGLLYDPKRKKEKEICGWLKEQLIVLDTDYRVRFNYPYRGAADGFTTYLRKVFGERYLGIEVEVNQKWVQNKKLDQSLKENFYQVINGLKKSLR